jgi:hypothetical protein
LPTPALVNETLASPLQPEMITTNTSRNFHSIPTYAKRRTTHHTTWASPVEKPELTSIAETNYLGVNGCPLGLLFHLGFSCQVTSQMIHQGPYKPNITGNVALGQQRADL